MFIYSSASGCPLAHRSRYTKHVLANGLAESTNVINKGKTEAA